MCFPRLFVLSASAVDPSIDESKTSQDMAPPATEKFVTMHFSVLSRSPKRCFFVCVDPNIRFDHSLGDCFSESIALCSHLLFFGGLYYVKWNMPALLSQIIPFHHSMLSHTHRRTDHEKSSPLSADTANIWYECTTARRTFILVVLYFFSHR